MNGYMCIVCKATNNSRAALVAHIRKQHHASDVDQFVTGGPMSPSEETAHIEGECEDCGASFGPSVEAQVAAVNHVNRTGHTIATITVEKEWKPPTPLPIGALIETGQACAVFVKRLDPLQFGWLMQDDTFIPDTNSAHTALFNLWKQQGCNVIPVGPKKAIKVCHVGDHPPLSVNVRGSLWANTADNTLWKFDGLIWSEIGKLKEGTEVTLV